MSPERHVKVFKNGRNQAVRIPREFEFRGEEAIMQRKATGLLSSPLHRNPCWQCWLHWRRCTRIFHPSLICRLIRSISDALPS